MAKQLPIDLDDVCIALDTAADEGLQWYLDLQTGSTWLVNDEYEPDENEGPTREQLAEDASRFVLIPTADPEQGLIDRRAFIEALSDAQLRESLEIALSGPGPTRRFKNVLGHVPEQRERWLAFKRQRTLERALAWLASFELEPGPPRRR